VGSVAGDYSEERQQKVMTEASYWGARLEPGAGVKAPCRTRAFAGREVKRLFT